MTDATYLIAQSLIGAIALTIAVIAILRVRALAKRLTAVDHGIMIMMDALARLDGARTPLHSAASQLLPETAKGKGIAQLTDAEKGLAVTASDVRATQPVASQPVPPDDVIAEPIQPVGVGVSDNVPDAEYTVEAVRKLYRTWCRERNRPKATSQIEIASLQYDSQLEGTNGSRKHLLKDASQLSEFVRFSPKSGTTGVVLPDPDAHFTPVVAYIFPGISRADYAQNGRLEEQQPVTIRRYSPSQWEAV